MVADRGALKKTIAVAFSNANAWIAAATVVTAMTAIVGGIISARTLRVIKGQLAETRSGSGDTHALAQAAKVSAQAAQDGLFAAQRAWVGATNATIDSLTADRPIIVRVPYSNSGHEPAVTLKTNLTVIALDADDFDKGWGQADAESAREQCFDDTAPVGGVAFPGGTYSMTYDTGRKSASPVFANSLIDGSGVALVTGCFAFRTQHVVRHSAFCFFYQKDRSSIQNLSICPWGNDAD